VARYVIAAPTGLVVLAGVRLRLFGAPALAVAVNVTLPMPVAVAVTVFVPASVPSVKLVDAFPELLVTALSCDKVPPPPVTLNTTVTPGCAVPKMDLTLATRGLGSVVATTAVCLLPLAMLMLCAWTGSAATMANNPMSEHKGVLRCQANVNQRVMWVSAPAACVYRSCGAIAFNCHIYATHSQPMPRRQVQVKTRLPVTHKPAEQIVNWDLRKAPTPSAPACHNATARRYDRDTYVKETR
jgi:hypothetical protein